MYVGGKQYPALFIFFVSIRFYDCNVVLILLISCFNNRRVLFAVNKQLQLMSDTALLIMNSEPLCTQKCDTPFHLSSN
jgi:hypothetical protein